MAPQRPHDADDARSPVPLIGNRIERRADGQTGTVYYADRIQVLVKWDDGTSSSLRVDRDRFRIVTDDDESTAA